MKKTLKKVGCAALALCTLAAGTVSFTSCTTDRPEVEMQLSFNGETYTLYYTLYRKYAPNTVNHFLALTENGYYDGLCVHNYEANAKLYTGAYTYDESVSENGGLVYKKYYDEVQTYKNFPIGVWRDQDKETPTYTLYGEFENNNFKVENGSFLSQSFGALTMYYTQKEEEENYVYVQKISEDKVVGRDYAHNSATSMFTISLTATAADKNYCTFATLDNTDVLQSLKTAVEEYANNYDADEGSFTVSKTVEVSEDDYYVGEDGLTETYYIPESPIVIEYVKVNKY
ncbi:MAG: peptidylprolyl isomerase [Clostridia bacterium]|nr:peptidylprolyl isomerase [Clostridia bacterium]